MAKLNTTIHISNSKGDYVFGPDEELPKWAVDKLRADGTPGIWADESDDVVSTDNTGDPALLDENEKLKARIAELEAAQSQAPATTAPEDISKLHKPQVEEIAKGMGIDTSGKTKDQLVEEINSKASTAQ